MQHHTVLCSIMSYNINFLHAFAHAAYCGLWCVNQGWRTFPRVGSKWLKDSLDPQSSLMGKAFPVEAALSEHSNLATLLKDSVLFLICPRVSIVFFQVIGWPSAQSSKSRNRTNGLAVHLLCLQCSLEDRRGNLHWFDLFDTCVIHKMCVWQG